MKQLLPIEQIAAKLNLPPDLYERRSAASAKLSLELLKDPAAKLGKLILVTATTPTPDAPEASVVTPAFL